MEIPNQVLTCLLLTLSCSLRAQTPVYVGVNYGLLKSTDAGATWNLLNVPLNTPFLSGYVLPQFLAMDPQSTSKIYFIGLARGTAFFASSDAGATWTVTPFIGLQPTHLVVDFAGQAIYISASPTRGTTFLYKSSNTGASWTQLPLPGTASEPSGSTVDKIFADPTVSGTVYVLSDNGYHFFKSTDFGSTWTEIVQKAPKKPSYVDPHNSLIWYDVTGGSVSSALFKSTDGTSTFTQLNIPSDEVTSVSVGAVSSTVYATGDVAGLGGTVLKSTDGGDTWTALKNGLFSSISGVVWADPVDASTVFVNDSINVASLYVSTDGGAHFNLSKIPEGPPNCVPGNCARPEVSDLLFAASAATIPPPPPSFSDNGIVNAASFAPGGLVPGGIATVFGTNLTSNTGINLTSSLPLPTAFLNNKVLINNRPVPLFAVDNVAGQQQINFQVPWEVASGPNATVVVENTGVASATVVAPVLAARPGIFNYAVGGNIFGAILHSNFQLADTGHPAKPGETVLIYCTGLGAVSSPPPDGAAGNGEHTVRLPVVNIGGVSAMVSFSGLAPGFAGLYQINAEVPASLASGNHPVVVMQAGAPSNSVLLPVV